jgi:hypothetical protein
MRDCEGGGVRDEVSHCALAIKGTAYIVTISSTKVEYSRSMEPGKSFICTSTSFVGEKLMVIDGRPTHSIDNGGLGG